LEISAQAQILLHPKGVAQDLNVLLNLELLRIAIASNGEVLNFAIVKVIGFIGGGTAEKNVHR